MGRVYESNGPDVKVRGTAQTVADKYLQLARDAHSAGDPVMAEGYFQHAEHYLRILAAAQPYPQSSPQRHPGGDDYVEDGDEAASEDEQSAVVSRGGGGGNGDTQPQQQPATSPAVSSETGEQPWGGPEPEFLRRGPSFSPSNGPGNGSGRSRRDRQGRSGNGRNEATANPGPANQAPASQDGSDDAGPAGEQSQDTTDQT
jgi:hypothetical protein